MPASHPVAHHKRYYLLTFNYNGVIMDTMRKMSTTERKIMAMAIDCEGAIVISRQWNKKQNRYYYQPYIQINNTSKELIDYLQLLYPSLPTKHIISKNPRHKDCWSFLLRAHDHVDFLEQITPYLIVKRKQAELIIAFYKDCYRKQFYGQHWARRPNGKFSSKISYETTEKQAQYQAQMKQLNRKGKRL